MKYLTKEWYETMQKTSFHLLLRVSSQAEYFSEDFFKKLYKKEEAKWLKLQEDVSNVTFEDIFPESFSGKHIDGSELTPEESEEMEKSYFEMREQARLNFDKNHSVFNPEQEKKNFKQALRHNVRHLQSSLPEEILCKVADIRVLALDCTSADVKKEITRFCKENKKTVEAAFKAYDKEYNKSFKHGEPSFAESFNFHDCVVTSCRKKGRDLVITFDNSGGFTDINQVIFKNCTVLKQEKPLRGAWLLYNEIYKSDGAYEIHILLSGQKMLDFIIRAVDVEYICGVSTKTEH